jgi:hypothetical protein
LVTLTSSQSKSAAENVKKPHRNLQNNFTIDKTKPLIYIDFVRLGEEKPLYADDARERVYLKFVNNSKWSIFISGFVYGRNEEKRGLYYEVEKRRKFMGELDSGEEIPTGYRQGHVGSPSSELKSGKSINFSVPRNHLAKDLLIRVEFDFEWNHYGMNSFGYGSRYPLPQMSVIFSASNLEQFLKERKIVQ